MKLSSLGYQNIESMPHPPDISVNFYLFIDILTLQGLHLIYVKRIQLNKSFTLRVANRDIPSSGCPMMSLTCPQKFQYIPLVSF